MLAKIGRRGQLTIPKAIRERFGLEEGHSLAFYVDGDGIRVRPVTKDIFDWVGAFELPEEWKGLSWEEIMAKTRQEMADHIARQGR